MCVLCLVKSKVYRYFLCALQMENELQRFHNQNLQLELNIDELRQKLKAAEREILQERQKVRFFLCHVTLKVFSETCNWK